MNKIVTTKSLSKQYGNVYRVKDLDLSVSQGEVYGFLGPNGAGKSTTLKMLLGLVKPNSGKITIFDKELNPTNRISILKNIGSLIESPSYYGHLTGMENMRIIQKLLSLPNKNINEALSIVRLKDQKNKKVNHYSLGMKQRLGIAMAIASFPKLLILDEPTNGLDPSGIEEIRELIKSLPEKYGMTVIISSHLLSEIDKMATYVGIINQGNLIYQDSMSVLHSKGSRFICLKTEDMVKTQNLLISKGFITSLQKGFISLENITDNDVAFINRFLVESRINVFRIEEHIESLEDIFLEITGKGATL